MKLMLIIGLVYAYHHINVIIKHMVIQHLKNV